MKQEEGRGEREHQRERDREREREREGEGGVGGGEERIELRRDQTVITTSTIKFYLLDPLSNLLECPGPLISPAKHGESLDKKLLAENHSSLSTWRPKFSE